MGAQVRELYRASAHRVELLPYYSRVAATLSRTLVEIGPRLEARLEREFRGLQRQP